MPVITAQIWVAGNSNTINLVLTAPSYRGTKLLLSSHASAAKAIRTMHC